MRGVGRAGRGGPAVRCACVKARARTKAASSVCVSCAGRRGCCLYQWVGPLFCAHACTPPATHKQKCLSQHPQHSSRAGGAARSAPGVAAPYPHTKEHKALAARAHQQCCTCPPVPPPTRLPALEGLPAPPPARLPARSNPAPPPPRPGRCGSRSTAGMPLLYCCPPRSARRLGA